MNLNETAAVEVMGWKEVDKKWMQGDEHVRSSKPERIRFRVNEIYVLRKPLFNPEQDWNDCMMVLDKAVERKKAELGKRLSGSIYPLDRLAKSAFGNCLTAVIKHGKRGAPLDYEDVTFATPELITRASIELVRRMK